MEERAAADEGYHRVLQPNPINGRPCLLLLFLAVVESEEAGGGGGRLISELT